METTETPELSQQPQPEKLPEITLSSEAKYFLHTAGRWASFLGVMGFIATGIIAICAIFFGSIFSMMPRVANMPFSASGLGTLVTIVYLGLAVWYFFLSLYLYQFGTKIKDGISYLNELEVTVALGKLKSFFKLWGISTIVIISLYILLFIVFIIFAAAFKGSLPTDANAYSFIY